jgi:biopolymer transport protein ExbD
MNVEDQPRGAGGWRALTIVCALLLVAGTLIAIRLRPGKSPGSALIKIDSNGTTRLGPLPLQNTNLRDAAFTAVSYLNQGTVSVSAAESTKMGDFVKTLSAMQRAGITSITVRTERPVTVTNQ